MEFDAASVKPSQAEKRPNFQLNAGDAKSPGGRFSASFSLWAYIVFAYKLTWNDEEYRAAVAKSPKWFTTDFFEIEARAEGNPSKDQMRLMMQALLAERFKLAVHFESREVPVFALTLVRPGKTGPKLRLHAEGPPCPESVAPLDARTAGAGDVFPPTCENLSMRDLRNGVRLLGSRNTTLPLLAEAIYLSASNAREVDKPVVDRTGLAGRVDFTVEYSPGTFSRPDPSNPDKLPADPQGKSFLAAVREQLGLKLESTRGVVRLLVIDHVERPTVN